MRVPFEDMYGPRIIRKVAVGSDTTPISLFTVTGDVFVRLVAVVTETWTTSDAITAEVGISGATASIIAQVADATDLTAGDIWHDASPDAQIEAESDAVRSFVISNGNDIILTTTGTVVNGQVQFYCLWRPLSEDGNVEVA